MADTVTSMVWPGGKRRQIRMNGHRRHVLDLGLDVVRHLDAEIVQHGAKGLLGEGVALLTRARQTDHQTVADQLVATYPFHRADVLDPGGMGHPQGQQAAEQGNKTERLHNTS